ncbi:uncharacterized protein C15orf39 homolog [Fukomys damarensis]|uniref:uncharacterized protein C15orf39 homolog n=1 Tax=Fukomys damarensis TaxID=885580 RepID=UPI00053FC6E8|nr:uncharacterized protein C15orf39 homolog [Fukomys damarensis]
MGHLKACMVRCCWQWGEGQAEPTSALPTGPQWSSRVPGGLDTFPAMAEKRPLGTLGPVMYGKLPRLEADSGPGHSLPPTAGSQDPCSYKGAYFSCPMGGTPKAGPERLASWTPYPPLYPASMAGPSLRADNLLTNCLLYRPPVEGSEKMQDSGPGELLPFSPQAHPYPGPLLAAPKPIYRSPLCYGLPTCLGEGPVKRPLDVDWTLVPGSLLPSADPPCSLASGKGQSLDGTFLRGVPAGGPGKDTSLGFSQCQAFLDKYRAVHNTGFLAPKYTAPYSGDPKQAVSEGPSNPWAQPLGPSFQETVPTHYPLPPPPQALPCSSACHRLGKQGGYSSVLPLQPLGAHKGTRYQAGGLGSSYLRQQASQTPYIPPSGLDTYSYPSAPIPAPSPGLKLDPPLAPQYPLDFAPQTLSFPYVRDNLSLCGASPGLGSTPSPQNSAQPVPQPSAFQRVCQPLPASRLCSNPVRPTEKPAQEAEEKTWLPSCRKEQPQPRSDEHLGGPIIIRDSPIPRTPPALPLRACAQEHQSLPQKENARPPSSPPMPIIDNVFSLAPYRDYLDAQTPEATAEPTEVIAELAEATATSESQDEGCRGALPATEGSSGPPCSLHEEVALDLSVKRALAETAPVKSPSPAMQTNPAAAAVDGTAVGTTLSGLPALKRMVTEVSGTPVTPEAMARTSFPGAPQMPVTTEGTPRTSFHSSVAFMFRKFKILRPAPLPAAMDPSTPTPPPAPPQPTESTPPPVPMGLQLLTQPLPVACFSLALPSPPAIAVASPAPTPIPTPSPAPPLPPTFGPALAPAPAPAPSSAPASFSAPAPAPVSTGASADSTEQHFTGLHTSLCDAISGSVAHSPPEKLREWMDTAGPWGRAAWQDCQVVQGLLGRLLSQLQKFVCTQQCPFPHVVRAGAIFVPIHLVKERLFPRLPPTSVDHVLQEHRVELRPTTLSEERALREHALQGCTSRMLKLLALRQLPDIYPDLLGLQWRDCIRRQLGDLGTKAGTVSLSEPVVARDEPEGPALAPKSPVPKVRRPGRKPPGSPGPEKTEAPAERASQGSSPAPAASASPPGPTLRARFRTLLETAWLNGLALPTWSHKTSGPDRAPPCPQLLGSQSHPL